MKQLFLLFLFASAVVVSYSQDVNFESGRDRYDKKPKLFTNTSNRFAPSQVFIDEVMNARLNSNVVIEVAQGFVFKGKVSSITSNAPGLTTITIQSSDVKGLLLSVSKVIQEDKSAIYHGIITSQKHSDMLLLEKDPITGEYKWIKNQVSNIIAD